VALLHSYLHILKVLFKEDCSHYLGVRSLRRVLISNQPIWETITHGDIASILWEIFLDARQFFSSRFVRNGEPPLSMLHLAHSFLATGTVKAQNTAPIARLLGQTRFAPSNGFGGPTTDTLVPPPVSTGRRATGNAATRTNAAYYPKIKAAVQRLLAAYPDALAATKHVFRSAVLVLDIQS
jgi:hypothetical protein